MIDICCEEENMVSHDWETKGQVCGQVVIYKFPSFCISKQVLFWGGNIERAKGKMFDVRLCLWEITEVTPMKSH